MHPWLAVEEKEVLKWIFIKSVEHRRQVTLTSIRQQGDDGLSGILRTLGDEGGTIGGGTGGDSYQQTVFLGELTSCADGIVIVNVQYLVNDTGVIGLGYETGTDTLYLVRTALSTVQHGEEAGSTAMIFTLGFCSFRYLPIPEIIPPVPTPATKMSILPSVSAHISGPVVA